ncbi:hypothetical protein J0H58_06120 [bacterium]|nr:hypothetical protein [bacterium]
MRGEAEVTGPEVALTIGTRTALGAGLGLLLAGYFSSNETRRAVGWILLLAGAFNGAVLASELFGRPRPLRVAFGDDRAPAGDPDVLSREAVMAGD